MAGGARVLTGGQVSVADRFVAPTLLDNIPAGARINREEIFGPLLPIYGFANLDEVIRRINSRIRSRWRSMYSVAPMTNIERIMRETTSGGACINHSVVQYLHGRLPFGGVNNSGIGNAHGHFGFKAFSHERAVVRTRLSLAARLLGPGEVPCHLRKILRAALKWL